MEQKRKLIPPVYFFATLLLMALLNRVAPLGHVLSPPWSWIGAAPLVLGFALGSNAFRSFMRAGTPVIPFERSTALVTEGAYRITRNPMYLGMVIMLCGVAILFGTVSPWLLIPAFALFIEAHFIRGEERFLEALFGEQYLSYKKRVRRWI